MTVRHGSGVLDTCAYIGLARLDPNRLPAVPEITAITMAELRPHRDPGRRHRRLRSAALRRRRRRDANDFAGLDGVLRVIAV
ncbi:MAG: hypothetical protein ACJ72N_18330 [Labedaea sp.]